MSANRGEGGRGARDRVDSAGRRRRWLILGPEPAEPLGAVGCRPAHWRHVHRQAQDAMSGRDKSVRRVPDPLASSNKASFKFMRTTSLADSKTAPFLPHLSTQSQEWPYVNDELRQGRHQRRSFL